MLAPVQAVLFDAVGTVLAADPPVADVYHEVAARYGSRLTRDEIRQRFRQVLAAEEPSIGHSADETALARSPVSEAGEYERWRRIVAQTIDDVPQATEQLFPELWRHFAEPLHWRLFDDVAAVWQTLRERGYTLGIASNFDGRLRQVAAGLPPLADCQHWFISAEIAYPKPDPRFFAAAAAELKLPPQQILLVGDDWTNDILGARAAGWQALWLQRDVLMRDPQSMVTLSSLLALLPGRAA